MPITLTTPIQTGAVDSNGPYTEVKLAPITLDPTTDSVWLVCQYGNTVNGIWVPGVNVGVVANKSFCVKDAGEDTDYTDMVTKLIEQSDVGKSFYDRIATILYQWLLDKGHYIGTIS